MATTKLANRAHTGLTTFTRRARSAGGPADLWGFVAGTRIMITWTEFQPSGERMDFELTDSQQEIVNGIRALCQRFPDEYWRGHDQRHEFPHEFYKAIADAGY